MKDVVQLNLLQFSLIYVLLVVVLLVMRRARVNKMKLLLIGSVRMTVQLVLVGFLLEYILSDAHPLYTVAFLAAMLVFSVQRILSGRKELNRRFKIIIAAGLSVSGLAVLAYFVILVVGEDFFNPQYTIPLAGMIIGNAMTGVSLGLKTFSESLRLQSRKLETLLNLGASPREILRPIVGNALETALLPTLNSMVGMGIIFLPGMMTGQILSGTSPTTAILYQIAIMIAICTSVCLSVFIALYFGNRTLYNRRNQLKF
ncbi:MAG: ABC transporter permease [Saccharofermentanales bacterium]|jgi:putative ABC transport system permease protein